MGDFDDVLAMEPGDEWDDHDPAVGAARGDRPEPPVAELHAPAATIELRGEVPGELMDALGPLRVLPAPVSPHRAVATLEVAPTERDHRWGLIDHDRGEEGLIGTAAELAAVLGDRLVDMARTADARHLVLPVAGVQLGDGRGVVVLDDDAERRRRLVTALVADGADYLGADHLVAVPGSRTLLACPTPVPGAALPAERVTPFMVADLVVVVGTPPEPPAAGDAVRLPRANGAARLLAAALQKVEDRSELVRVVTALAAGADVWWLRSDAPAALAARVAGLPAGSPRDVATWRRPLPDRDERVAIRFAHGGLLVDTDRAVVLELDESELAVIDELGWFPPQDPAAADAVLEDLAVAGVDLRAAASAGRRRPVGVAAHGLPDSPTGRSATLMWGDVEGHRGSNAELVEELLDELSAHGIEPLVAGSVALAHDGPLPEAFVAAGDLELLVPAERSSAAVAVLRGVPGVRAHDDGVTVERGGAGTRVTVRGQLAAGPFGELVDHDELMDRAVPFRLGRRWVPALHPDDRFVLSCVRVAGPQGATDPACRAVVLEAPTSRVGMAAVFEASARWGATRSVIDAIRTVDARLPGLSRWLVERANRPAPRAGSRRRRRRG